MLNYGHPFDKFVVKKFSPFQYVLAWSVHAFTASGMVFGFLAILAIQSQDFAQVFVWLTVAFLVDAIDGTLARAAKVSEVLPNFKGDSIDHVIDFANYAIIPAYFIHEAGLLPEEFKLLGVSAILLVSCFYYGKTTYVTEDLYFEGFPILWNFVAFYLYFVFDFSPMANLVLLLILCILPILPWKYPYPSQTKEYRLLTFTALFFIAIGIIGTVVIFPEKNNWIQLCSYVGIVYIFGMAIFKTFFSKIKS
nr:CDP-alcohol phosphatidyltransferase family protein [Aquiflexum gelatinilyticum]